MNPSIVQKYQRLKQQVGNRVLSTLLHTTLMIIATMFITDSWLNDITDSNKQAKADYIKMSRVSQIRTQIERAESAQRGYLLSQDESYLPAYTESKANVLTQLQQLATLLNSSNTDPQEQALFHQINSDIGAKISEMDITITLIENARTAQALDLVRMNQGQRLQSEIRTNVQNLYSLIEKRLNELLTKRSEKIKWARWSILLTILILSAVILITLNDLIKAAREKDDAKQALAQENQNYQDRLAQNLRQMQTLVLDVQTEIEDSRAQLARDLHDELGSILTAIRMDLGWSIKKSQADLPEVAEKLQRTQTYLDRAIVFKRQVVEDLHPSMLDNFGLWMSLENMAQESAQRNQWQLHLNLPEQAPELPKGLQLVVYRVVQETLNNASKYAQARQFTLDITMDERNLKIDMIDDGVGTDLNQSKPQSHGIAGMKNRIFAAGGQIHISSQPKHGMHTQILLPLDTMHKTSSQPSGDA